MFYQYKLYWSLRLSVKKIIYYKTTTTGNVKSNENNLNFCIQIYKTKI